MAFGKAARRDEPPEVSLDLSERLAPYGEQEPSGATWVAPVRPGGDVRLVIVDDLPAIRTMMTLAVSLFDGITIVGEAGGAVEAVDVCAEAQPDAVLLDVDMPEVDGLAAIPLLRAAAPEAKIAMYSNDETSRQAAIDAGADAFFLKLSIPPVAVLAEIADLCAVESPG
ncbi:MAG: hypothetical protein NVSMB12_08200 [Acidimicrobiales bacterium]